jgi:hypothetical protein
MHFTTAGERVFVESELSWVDRLVERAVGSAPRTPDGNPGAPVPTVRICVQASRMPFSTEGLRPITRGAVSDGHRTVLTDACSSGFDLLAEAQDDELSVTARYRPARRTRVANLALSDRFGLLSGQVLVHYPALWRAGWRGRVPLHAAAVATASGTPLLAGPGGIGKSTVLVRLLGAGAVATADNLCCADTVRCFGLLEPLRVDAGAARAGGLTSHGRQERPLPSRLAELTPDRVVVLERGPRTEMDEIAPEDAARVLTAGTYAAGELRRYWAFAATLALATGRGPAHPPVGEVARQYAGRLPCLRIRVGDGVTVSAEELCGVAP